MGDGHRSLRVTRLPVADGATVAPLSAGRGPALADGVPPLRWGAPLRRRDLRRRRRSRRLVGVRLPSDPVVEPEPARLPRAAHRLAPDATRAHAPQRSRTR